jgi:hypothetical protein
MTLRLTLAAGFALAIVAYSTLARAAAAIPLRLQYSAPDGCPNADAFLAQVAVRAQHARAADAHEASATLRVVVKDVPGGSAGTLELVAPGATLALREVSAADCAQVVAALALMTALAIEPNSATTVPAPAPPATASPVVAEASARDARARARWVLAVGGLFEALGGVAPDPILLVRPFAQLVREDASPWSYALRLSLARAHAELANDEGSADVTWWAARLEACPMRGAPLRPLALSACLPVEAGRLAAVGSGFADGQRVARPWLSLGAAGRIEWSVFEVLVIEAAGELFFPLVRDRFYVGPNATLHRAPAVAGGVSVGVGARFP